MRKFAILAASLIISGCAHHPGDCAFGIHHDDCLPGTAGYSGPETDPEKIAENEAIVRVQVQKAEAAEDRECKSYGLTFGTSDYAKCRLQLLSLRVTVTNSNRAAAQQNAANRIQALSVLHSMQPQPVPAPPMYVMPTSSPSYQPMINTHCSAFGNSVNCISQ